jgi:hypothetical protein
VSVLVAEVVGEDHHSNNDIDRCQDDRNHGCLLLEGRERPAWVVVGDACQSLSLKWSARTTTATTTSSAARMIGIMAVSCWKGGCVPPRLVDDWD